MHHIDDYNLTNNYPKDFRNRGGDLAILIPQGDNTFFAKQFPSPEFIAEYINTEYKNQNIDKLGILCFYCDFFIGELRSGERYSWDNSSKYYFDLDATKDYVVEIATFASSNERDASDDYQIYTLTNKPNLAILSIGDIRRKWFFTSIPDFVKETNKAKKDFLCFIYDDEIR